MLTQALTQHQTEIKLQRKHWRSDIGEAMRTEKGNCERTGETMYTRRVQKPSDVEEGNKIEITKEK